LVRRPYHVCACRDGEANNRICEITLWRVVPDSFLGGSAPRLACKTLSGTSNLSGKLTSASAHTLRPPHSNSLPVPRSRLILGGSRGPDRCPSKDSSINSYSTLYSSPTSSVGHQRLRHTIKHKHVCCFLTQTSVSYVHGRLAECSTIMQTVRLAAFVSVAGL
jgi:hypothetical protein